MFCCALEGMHLKKKNILREFLDDSMLGITVLKFIVIVSTKKK